MTSYREMIAKQHVLLSSRRKIMNFIMLSLTGLVTVLALVPLFWIIGYVIYRGGSYLNPALFTELPRPRGVQGGGGVHCLETSMLCPLLAAVVPVPPGRVGGIFGAQ